MQEKKLTDEDLRAMVKKSFANVDIDEGCKMCVLPFQSLVDTVDLYEDKLAWQEVEIQQLTEKKAELQKQADEYKAKIEQGTLIELPCKVGDTVYIDERTWTWYNSCFNRAFIGGEFFVVGKITSIRFTDKSILIKVKATYRENQRLYKKKDYPISAIGKTVFLTREEAEKRLKELQE